LSKAKNWIYTRLNENDAVEIEIDGKTYKASRLVLTYAFNEFGTVKVSLALGRNARNNKAAAILEDAESLSQMLPVQVYVNISGDFDAKGNKWPGGRKLAFDGYFVGYQYEKQYGKVSIVMSAVQWLVDLDASSSLNAGMHPDSPSSLLAPAVLASQAGAAGLPVWLSQHIDSPFLRGIVGSDVWSAMKTVLCTLTTWKGFRSELAQGCGGSGNIENNNRALTALSRIEGPATTKGADCSLDYDVGFALAPDVSGNHNILQGIADDIGHTGMSGMFNSSFWDVMLGAWFPNFVMGIMPLIDSAVVIPYLPAWRRADVAFWKEISPDEYVAVSHTSKILEMMRGIAIFTGVEGYIGSGQEERQTSGSVTLGGCFTSDAEGDSDGAIRYISAPEWLSKAIQKSAAGGTTTGNKQKAPCTRTSTTGHKKLAKPGEEGPIKTYPNVSEVMRRFSQAIYLKETLRGRELLISGKLRFDIAPGSHIRVKGSPEEFLAGVDKLGTNVMGFVQRVTTVIDAESSSAMTSFGMTYVRNEKENGEERTSAVSHPLFGQNIVAGAALSDEFDVGSNS
jgi:hypothetical protein